METAVSRRSVIKAGGAASVLGLFVAAGLVKPGVAYAQASWNKDAFAAKSVADVVKALGGAQPAKTTDVSWGSTPEIAENGAVVPINITSRIPNTQSIAVLIEKNPSTLAAKFDFPGGTEAAVSTRVKMGQSSDVHALIKTADGKYFIATREVKVTLGGCGG